MGAILLAGGAEGKRSCLPNSRVMIHQGSAGTEGTIADMNRALAEFNRTNDTIFGVLAKHCKRDKAQVAIDCDRDHWMSAEESLAYGIIDKVLEPSGR